MLRDMTGPQLLEWRAYADLEPFDEERADLRAAQICAVLAEVNRDKKKRPEPFTPKDFLFHFGRGQAREQTWQEQKALMRMAARTQRSKNAERPRLSKKQRMARDAAAAAGPEERTT